MLSKLGTIIDWVFKIGPGIAADVTGTIKKIESDQTLHQKILDALDGVIEVLSEVAKLL